MTQGVGTEVNTLVIAPFGVSSATDVDRLTEVAGCDASTLHVLVPAGRPSLHLELAGAQVTSVPLATSPKAVIAMGRVFLATRHQLRACTARSIVWTDGGWIGPYELILLTGLRALGMRSCYFADSSSVTLRQCGASLAVTARAIKDNLRGFTAASRSGSRVEAISLPDKTRSIRRVAYARLDVTLAISSEPGGARSHSEGVIGGFQDNRVKVTSLSPVELRTFGRERADFVEILLPAKPNVYPELVPALVDRIAATQLRKIDFDSIDLVYERYGLFGTAGIELAHRLRVPLVLEVNASEVEFRQRWDRIRFHQAASHLEQELFSRASLVVTVSERVRDEVLRIAPAARVLVVPNGVDESLFRPVPVEAERQRIELGVSREQVLVGFFGRFYRWHGIDTLKDAIPTILAADERAHVLLVGDGPEGEGLKRATLELSERVHFSGIVPHDTVPALMQACDILVSPHAPVEGFVGSPMKIFEYLVSGRAIVASDLEQIGSVIRDEETGLLVPPGSVEVFSSAVVRLIRDAQLRSKLGEMARADALAHHTWSIKMKEVLECMRANSE